MQTSNTTQGQVIVLCFQSTVGGSTLFCFFFGGIETFNFIDCSGIVLTRTNECFSFSTNRRLNYDRGDDNPFSWVCIARGAKEIISIDMFHAF